ncbi:unnamed protein product, partial [Amoebophrya sp. A120]
DPQYGFFETLCVSQKEEFPTELGLWEGMLDCAFDQLSYEPGKFSRSQAILLNQGKIDSVKQYVAQKLANTPLCEMQQEQPHAERHVQNDKRINCAGSFFSMQRERFLKGDRDGRVPTFKASAIEYAVFPADAEESLNMITEDDVQSAR